jgi:hypothetical protein
MVVLVDNVEELISQLAICYNFTIKQVVEKNEVRKRHLDSTLGVDWRESQVQY